MTNDQQAVLQDMRKRCLAAYALVAASVSRTNSFDPDADYTPEEREPFDALSDRFVRVTEISLRFFRSYADIRGPFFDELKHLEARLQELSFAG